jgi:acetoin utilization protein AcuC
MEVPGRFPPGFAATLAEFGADSVLLRDLPRLAHPDDFSRAQAFLERNLAILERRLFPLHGLSPGAS